MTKSEAPVRAASTPRPVTAGVSSPTGVTRELTLVLRAVIARVLREPASHPDVEDAMQESLRRVVEGVPPAGVALSPWAIGIARHVALDAIRGRQRHRARFEPVLDEAKEVLAGTADEAATPLDGALLRESAERVRAALSVLPEGQRNAIELFYLEGLSYDEIAARLRVPSGTVAIWLMRAKTALHTSLKEKAK